jgi:hypothetical protein
MASYPILNGVSKPWHMCVYVTTAPPIGPRRKGEYPPLVFVDVAKLASLIWAESEKGGLFSHFELDDMGRILMRSGGRGNFGVWLTLYLDEDQDPDAVYAELGRAFGDHGWSVE